MLVTPSVSNIQQELLKLYASDIADFDLVNTKRYLAKYFASKAIAQADDIWEQKGYGNEKMNNWLTENDSDAKCSH